MCVCPPARESRSIARARRVATAGGRVRARGEDGWDGRDDVGASHLDELDARAFAVSHGNDGTAMV